MDPFDFSPDLEAWFAWIFSLTGRLFIGTFGLFLLGGVVRGARARSISPLRAAAFVIVGLFCAIGAVWPDFVFWLVSVPYATRVRVAMGVLSLVVLSITLEALRTDVLEERYALLWVATSLIILLVAIFPQAVAVVKILTGIHYTNAVMAVLIAFLLLVTFHLSLALSRHRDHQARSAQRLAVLEQRVLRLEEALRTGARPDHLFPPPPELAAEPPKTPT
jgi:hypothetical protein